MGAVNYTLVWNRVQNTISVKTPFHYFKIRTEISPPRVLCMVVCIFVCATIIFFKKDWTYGMTTKFLCNKVVRRSLLIGPPSPLVG